MILLFVALSSFGIFSSSANGFGFPEYDDTPVPCSKQDEQFIVKQVGCMNGACSRPPYFLEFACNRAELCCTNACGTFCYPSPDAPPAKRDIMMGMSLFPLHFLSTTTTTTTTTTATTTTSPTTTTTTTLKTSPSTVTPRKSTTTHVAVKTKPTTTKAATVKTTPTTTSTTTIPSTTEVAVVGVIEEETTTAGDTYAITKQVGKIVDELWSTRRKKLPACLEAWLEVQKDPSKHAIYGDVIMCPPMSRFIWPNNLDSDTTTPMSTTQLLTIITLETTTTGPTLPLTTTAPPAWKFRRPTPKWTPNDDKNDDPNRVRPPRDMTWTSLFGAKAGSLSGTN